MRNNCNFYLPLLLLDAERRFFRFSSFSGDLERAILDEKDFFLPENLFVF